MDLSANDWAVGASPGGAHQLSAGAGRPVPAAPPPKSLQAPDPFLSGDFAPAPPAQSQAMQHAPTFPEGGIFAGGGAFGADPEHPPSNSHLLGVNLIAIAAGTGLGVYYGGAFGGIAGALFGGAAVNVFRAGQLTLSPATPESGREALISLTWAAVSAAAGGYVAWRVHEQRAGAKKERA